MSNIYISYSKYKPDILDFFGGSASTSAVLFNLLPKVTDPSVSTIFTSSCLIVGRCSSPSVMGKSLNLGSNNVDMCKNVCTLISLYL